MNDNTLSILLSLWLGLTLHHHGYKICGLVFLLIMLWDLLFSLEVLDERSIEPLATAMVCTVITYQFDFQITGFMCFVAWVARTINYKPEPT